MSVLALKEQKVNAMLEAITRMFSSLPERRQYRRVRARNRVKIIEEATGRQTITSVLNISEGGIKFCVGHEIQNGSSIKVMLNMPKERKDISTEAKVVWTKRSILKDEWTVGASFTWVLEDDLVLLRDFVKSGHKKLSIRRGWYIPRNQDWTGYN